MSEGAWEVTGEDNSGSPGNRVPLFLLPHLHPLALSLSLCIFLALSLLLSLSLYPPVPARDHIATYRRPTNLKAKHASRLSSLLLGPSGDAYCSNRYKTIVYMNCEVRFRGLCTTCSSSHLNSFFNVVW